MTLIIENLALFKRFGSGLKKQLNISDHQKRKYMETLNY